MAGFMLSTFTVFTVLLVIIAALVNNVVPEPYMDEIFHIPQAQQYCRGDYFNWDPKLTTPPGLYVVSLGIKAITDIFAPETVCSVAFLRATNLVFALLLYFVLIALSSILHPNAASSTRRHFYAFCLSLFPVSFFYFFLYYTDTGSTLFVLLSYLCVKTGRYYMAGLMAAVAVTFRQTNIVWLFYFMVLSTIQLIQSRSSSNASSYTLYDPACDQIDSIFDVFLSIFSLLRCTARYSIYIVPRVLTLIMVLTGFAAFLKWNNGIVLGDRSNHVAGLHFPQLLYYTSFLSGFSSFFLVNWHTGSELWTIFCSWRVKSLFIALGLSLMMIYVIRHHTYEHPFLLSDNRHYSFYVWKNVYRRHGAIRYALIPLYALSARLNINRIKSSVSVLWFLGYILTLLLTLVPSPLLEFRYFILPFLFFCIHIPPPSTKSILCTILLYGTINAITFYMFLFHPFAWPQNPGESQRFMW